VYHDGGGIFLGNIGNLSTQLHDVITQKTVPVWSEHFIIMKFFITLTNFTSQPDKLYALNRVQRINGHPDSTS
jgi:hypothetical protein